MKGREGQGGAMAAPDDVARAAGEMVGELMHGLRNPLSAFATSLDLLVSGRGLDADDVASLHRVLRNELRKMTDTVSRAAELARLGALTLAPLDLAALVASRVAAREEDFRERAVRLHLALPTTPTRLAGDASLLDAALDALLQNALDAMAGRDDRALSVSLVVGPGHHATVRVQDTGAGVPEVARRNVFRLLFTTRAGAAGMGLPFARWVALGHGGTLTLEFDPAGTTAVLTLPLVAE